MEERHDTSYEEVQLDFSFVAELSSFPPPLPPQEKGGKVSRASRARGLGKVLATARDELLEAPLADLDQQLLLLFEFCEAALTRALDVVPLRKKELFSTEEYRSVRGIGQAQWLLSEAHSKREMRSMTEGKGKSRKKTVSEE